MTNPLNAPTQANADTALTPLDNAHSFHPAMGDLAHHAGGTAHAAADPNSPLAAMGFDAASGPKKRVSSLVVSVAIALAVGGGLLFAMRQAGLKPVKAEPDAPLAIDLTRAAAVPAVDHRLLLDDLRADRAAVQVPPEAIKSNPFKMGPDSAPDSMTAQSEADAAAARARSAALAQAAQRRTELDRAAQSLSLSGVLGGSKPCCTINSRIYRIGDGVDGIFTVKSIDGTRVVLEADGEAFVLTTSEVE